MSKNRTQEAISEDIRERQRINDSLESFFASEMWTPAMGAMLVSGVLPIPGCRVIPESGVSLRNPAVRADKREIDSAVSVLRRWNLQAFDDITGKDSEHLRDLEPPELERIPAEVTPFDFLHWCYYEYEEGGLYFRPRWYQYVFSYLEWDADPLVPTPAPRHLIERAANLEGHVATFAERVTFDQPKPQQSPMAKKFANVLAEAIRATGKAPFSEQIIAALYGVEAPWNATLVWERLFAMAKGNSSPLLRCKGDTKLQVRASARWLDYDVLTLKQYLDRWAKKTGQERRTSRQKAVKS